MFASGGVISGRSPSDDSIPTLLCSGCVLFPAAGGSASTALSLTSKEGHMPKTKVRVTMFADPIEVDPDEVPVLRAQGLLAEEAPSEPASAPRPAAAKAASKKDGE